jgi:glutamyl-tRNA synthetase
MSNESQKKVVRTRIAPSPTGYPHIGTIYQALFDYAYAKKHGGYFVVRIEDTDRTRFVSDAEERLFAAFDWFELPEDESPRKGGPSEPYRQSERLEIYQMYVRELIKEGHAYYCFCTKERLDEIRKKQQNEGKIPMYDRHCRFLKSGEIEMKLHESIPHVVRMKVPENGDIIIRDEIRGEIVFQAQGIDDQVLLKTDGYPTYHLAVVVDDHLMGITHVVRAEEWISSTPKHYLLYEYFGWERPLFFHTSLLRNPDKSKLSKRHGHTNVSWYQENGYLPEAILNFIALLGWSHPEEKEIFTLDEFIRLFDLKHMKAIGPIFDLTKLTWMNQQYIMSLPEDSLHSRILKYYERSNGALSVSSLLKNEKTVQMLLPLVRERMQTLKDFASLASHFFEEPKISLENIKEKEIITELKDGFVAIQEWQKEQIFTAMKEVMTKHSIRMPVLYRLLTGSEKGLPLPESLEILGKEKTLMRISNALVNNPIIQ